MRQGNSFHSSDLCMVIPKTEFGYMSIFRRSSPRKMVIVRFTFFHFNSVLEMSLEIVLPSCENSGIDIFSDRFLSELEFANKDPIKLQSVLVVWKMIHVCVFYLRTINCCHMIGLAQNRPLFFQGSN